ncbi:sensor histidine kinase [Leptospira alstonii]|uniref:histidine kinase n=2 Tax=Leptospira alstonii TaxID=28452 RepID=M6CS29_9LEPT|nr:ATP-binding protein [Leptospira alstonii]EMJ93341.1 GHKL domain protein [Leptospira alstonii serovar Sichuan str. 79601]EQA82177.1 GHKL domain protein [Leptospira alstonii serovar Pingchang str. 80-412]
MTESEFQLLSHLRTPIGVLDKDLRIIICNSSFVELCSCSHWEELKNRELSEILPFQNSSLLREFKNCTLKKTILFRERFLNALREEVDLKGSLTRQNSGEKEFLFLEISDSSSDLNLKTKEKEIAAVISKIHHELQEPIRNQTKFLKLLSDKYSNGLNEKGKEFLRISLDGAERLWDRINGLLLFLRIEKERNVFKILSLKEILEESLISLEEKLVKAGITVRVEGEFPKIMGNPFLLKELFSNLVTNSIQFRNTNVACKLFVSYFEESNFHLILVKDNGIGVDHSEKNYFIDLFKKYHLSSGPGTGLFFCKRIAELHGGSLEIETDRTSGFGVIVRFPRKFKLE